MDIFERLESEVRGYCRNFPTVFTTASGCQLTDESGRTYIDLFAGAGALNYGHCEPRMRDRLVDYLTGGGVIHTLDMMTAAKRDFIATFEEVVLQPRGLEYKLQFPGPTGTNAVEAAIKLARKVTGRESVVSFTNAFHGMTLGSLSLTGNGFKRAGAGVALSGGTPMPFDGFLGQDVDSLAVFEAMLSDGGSGVDTPAAVILETVQAEGGVNVARADWLRGLAALCKRHGILLIVDDIQVGCGRTGPFFSFEGADIVPDIVCLSKSLSGFGLPLALVLIRPELDIWEPGEHNGTFRGHNPAFVTATAALDLFWRDDALSAHVAEVGAMARRGLERLADRMPGSVVRGRGLIQGIEFPDAELAGKISAAAFERGVIVETAGPDGQVLKLLPPLVISLGELATALDAIEAAFDEVTGNARDAVLERAAAVVGSSSNGAGGRS